PAEELIVKRAQADRPAEELGPEIRIEPRVLLLEERRLSAAMIDEVSRQGEVTLVARGVIKLHQPEFDLLVPRLPFALTRTKHGIKMIGVLDCDVQESAFAGRLIVSNGRFVHMAGTEHLVAECQEFPAALRIDKLKVRVEIAVLHLGGADGRDGLFYLRCEL